MEQEKEIEVIKVEEDVKLLQKQEEEEDNEL